MKRQCLTSDDAVFASRPLTRPCSDCPWSRSSLASWLGALSAPEWLKVAHSDAKVACHTTLNQQCAGAAIYRANVAKISRDPTVLRLDADRAAVFATPAEFTDHHGEIP